MFTLPPDFNPDDLWGTDDPAAREQLFKASIDPQAHPLVPDPNPFGYGTVKGASALHATASADCLMQVSGESVFVLEDTEIRLRPGDWLIVNGVPHSIAGRRAGWGRGGSQVDDLAVVGNREDAVLAGVRADGKGELRLAP